MLGTEPVDLEALVDAMAPILGFAIAGCRASVIANLELSLMFAELVVSFPLDDHEESAEVFRA